MSSLPVFSSADSSLYGLPASALADVAALDIFWILGAAGAFDTLAAAGAPCPPEHVQRLTGDDWAQFFGPLWLSRVDLSKYPTAWALLGAGAALPSVLSAREWLSLCASVPRARSAAGCRRLAFIYARHEWGCAEPTKANGWAGVDGKASPKNCTRSTLCGLCMHAIYAHSSPRPSVRAECVDFCAGDGSLWNCYGSEWVPAGTRCHVCGAVCGSGVRV